MAKASKKEKQKNLMGVPSGRGNGDSIPEPVTSTDIEEMFLAREEKSRLDEERQFKDAALLQHGSLLEHIEFVYQKSGQKGLFYQIERVIDGQAYTYGIKIDSLDKALKVCHYYFVHERPILIKQELDRIKHKLALCESDVKKFNYLNAVLKNSIATRDLYSTTETDLIHSDYFILGYESEKYFLDRWDFNALRRIDYTMPDAGMKAGRFVHSLLFGAINNSIESYVLSELDKMDKLASALSDTTLNLETTKCTVNKIEFTEQYDVVLFFYYIGIYKIIYDNANKNASNASKLIAELAGIPNKWNSIRPLFSNASKYDKNNTQSVKLFNKASIDRVLEKMEKFGLDTTYLREIKAKIKFQ